MFIQRTFLKSLSYKLTVEEARTCENETRAQYSNTPPQWRKYKYVIEHSVDGTP